MGQVVSQSELISLRGQWKRAGKGVVCASGCFDLLHPGHIRLLEHARSLGDVLIVAIESDAAATRTINSGQRLGQAQLPSAQSFPPLERAEILAALSAVACVVEFEGASPHEFLARCCPMSSCSAEAVVPINPRIANALSSRRWDAKLCAFRSSPAIQPLASSNAS